MGTTMYDKNNGKRVARMAYETITDVFDGDQSVDLDHLGMEEWIPQATVALDSMLDGGALKGSDVLDLAAYLTDGDAWLTLDMLENGGLNAYLGGRLYAMRRDGC